MGDTSSFSRFPPARSSREPPKYDFKPFLSAPAVVQKARETGGAVKPLHIPESHIPSPLARDISPDQLLGLKAFLVGSRPETSSRTGNGREIWLSWKRAWDLWNNHYIHGRENPSWIKRQFEHMQKIKQQSNNFYYDIGEVQDVEMMDVDDDPSTTYPNESDGGFRAIKDFPEFKEPPPFDPELGDDGIIWDDLISNSVWRPRWVGEKTPNIDVDIGQDDFIRESHLERDRGVDCGRLPYPVLRPLIEYVQLANGAFIKKKIWDGVTGTVFNMPIKPLEHVEDPEDDKLERVQQMYGNSYAPRKPRFANSDIFPLDIRRIMKVSATPTPRSIPPLLEDGGDDLLRDRRPGNGPLPLNHRATSKADPWYVTEEQKDLIDYPPRQYPPPEQIYKPEIIPVDETIFKEELESDQLSYTKYFVTNLHGGTLIINGLEVRKGDIAGPLPKFAVIECPGGQIAFWFGSYGRHHLAGSEETHYSKWAGLRQKEGWMFTGLSAGQVWNAKIQERLERIQTGEREDDDEQWEEWLSSSEVEKPDPITSVTYRLSLPGPVPENGLPLPADITGPHVLFPSEQHELAWILAQREIRRTPDAMDTTILPSNGLFFPGSKQRYEYFPREELTTEFVSDTWCGQGEYVKQLQQLHVASIRDKEQREADAELKRLESFGLPAYQKDYVLPVHPRTKQLKHAELFQLREEQQDREFQQESERQLQQGLSNESIQQLQREWTDYTAGRRVEKRKRAEEGISTQEETRKSSNLDLSSQLSGLNAIVADELEGWQTMHDNKKSETAFGRPSLESLAEKERERLALHDYSNRLLAETITSVEPEARSTKRPKIILNHTPKPDDISPMMGFEDDFDMFEPRSSPVDEDIEEQQLQEAQQLSAQFIRGDIQEALTEAAVADPKAVPQYLVDQGFSSMDEYLDLVRKNPVAPKTRLSDAKQTLFVEFQGKLRKAYEDGSRARARLHNMGLEQYTVWKANLSLDDWLDIMVRQTCLQVDDIPLKLRPGMTADAEEQQRLKWSRLCDMVIIASDFEAQTKAASLPPETHFDDEGKPFAVI